MNKVELIGRLTKDPEVHYTTGENAKATLRYTLAVSRRFKNAEGNYEADFISCVAWDRNAEFIAKYFKKGSLIGIVGNIRTGSFTNKDGQKVYTTDVYTDEIEPIVGRNEGGNTEAPQTKQPQRSTQKRQNTSFMNIPDTGDDDVMPF